MHAHYANSMPYCDFRPYARYSAPWSIHRIHRPERMRKRGTQAVQILSRVILSPQSSVYALFGKPPKSPGGGLALTRPSATLYRCTGEGKARLQLPLLTSTACGGRDGDEGNSQSPVLAFLPSPGLRPPSPVARARGRRGSFFAFAPFYRLRGKAGDKEYSQSPVLSPVLLPPQAAAPWEMLVPSAVLNYIGLLTI